MQFAIRSLNGFVVVLDYTNRDSVNKDSLEWIVLKDKYEKDTEQDISEKLRNGTLTIYPNNQHAKYLA